MTRHYSDDGRGAACGATLRCGDDPDSVTLSMSEPTCRLCRTIVQLMIEVIAEMEPRDTLPGLPLGPLPVAVDPDPVVEDPDDVVSGTIETPLRGPPPRPMTAPFVYYDEESARQARTAQLVRLSR